MTTWYIDNLEPSSTILSRATNLVGNLVGLSSWKAKEQLAKKDAYYKAEAEIMQEEEAAQLEQFRRYDKQRAINHYIYYNEWPTYADQFVSADEKAVVETEKVAMAATNAAKGGRRKSRKSRTSRKSRKSRKSKKSRKPKKSKKSKKSRKSRKNPYKKYN